MYKCKYILPLGGLFLLASCGDGLRENSATSIGNPSIIPKMLLQTKTLDRSQYRIDVLLDGIKQNFTLSEKDSTYLLDLGDVPKGDYNFTVEVSYPLEAPFSVVPVLYNYESTFQVTGKGQRIVVSDEQVDWPDDDNDGFSNFIELDQASVDVDNDGTANYLDTDSDNDQTPDESDPPPYTQVIPVTVDIAAGCFDMGSRETGEGSIDSENPVHEVCVESFQLGQFAVTFDEYDAYTDAMGKSRLDDEGWGRGSRPVIWVSWSDANDYVDWLSKQTGFSYRLPTEAEWEYAVRAGGDSLYGFGDSESALCDFGNGSGLETSASWRNTACSDDFSDRTAPSGSFQANAWGLYDMHGNVLEWVADSYHNNYDGAPNDGSIWNESSSSQKVLRGGSWDSSPYGMRSAYRMTSDSSDKDWVIGFRLLREN